MVGLIIIIASVLTAAIIGWKMRQLKKDIYEFTDALEKNLDYLIAGKELDCFDETNDTLSGKINGRLQRVAKVWTEQETEIKNEKNMIEALISDISHQTKTPIANQKIYLEFLAQEELSKKGQEFVARLVGQTEKLDFLLQSMVKMSRLETGIIRIQKQAVNLPQTLQHAVEAIVPAAAQKQIELFVDYQENFQLLHDKKWTEEAIFNILDNGVKYTDIGGSIHITVEKQEVFSVISIKDSGKGIALERQAQIFTRFYREPEVHDQPGIGIGLYLARKIIELQNGYIEVRSEPGKGSDFLVYLPNG